MSFVNRPPKIMRFGIILFVLILFSLPETAFAKRHGGGGRGHNSARGRRGGHRGGRVARGRHGRRLSRREARAQRARIANEQASALKAMERRLHRPLTKRERTAEMRRIEARHRRDLEAARRRAEAARLAAIARQRALEDEARTFIARDDINGEDLEVRRVAVSALGNHAGTVVVMDPKTGRVYSIVNQEWALRRGFKPCSTIKLVTGLAGLNEKVIDPSQTVDVTAGYQLDLTGALAHSNNTYFQQVGGRVGFDKMISYARQLGLGEKTGINEPNEFAGRVPAFKTGYAVNHMSSHGDDFEVTAVQLATLVSAMSNGGKLLRPYVFRAPQDETKFKPVVRRQVEIQPDAWQRMVPGMVGAVDYGSGRRAYDPSQTVAGKTGTCIGQGSWLGLFTSYAPLVNPRLAVVVITRGADAHSHLPAAVAGQIYRDLSHRFGTPTTLQFASAPSADAPKDATDEEAQETKAAVDKEAAAENGDAATMNSTTPDETKTAKTENQPASKVKPTMMAVPKRTEDKSKPAAGAKATPAPTPKPEERPRRVNEDQP